MGNHLPTPKRAATARSLSSPPAVDMDRRASSSSPEEAATANDKLTGFGEMVPPHVAIKEETEADVTAKEVVEVKSKSPTFKIQKREPQRLPVHFNDLKTQNMANSFDGVFQTSHKVLRNVINLQRERAERFSSRGPRAVLRADITRLANECFALLAAISASIDVYFFSQLTRNEFNVWANRVYSLFRNLNQMLKNQARGRRESEAAIKNYLQMLKKRFEEWM